MPSFRELTLTDARHEIARYNEMSDEEFDTQKAKWARHEIGTELDDTYSALRKEILAAFVNSGGDDLFQTEGKSRAGYTVDVAVGLHLYKHLGQLGLTLADASNDNIWRYLTVKVFPDI